MAYNALRLGAGGAYIELATMLLTCKDTQNFPASYCPACAKPHVVGWHF